MKDKLAGKINSNCSQTGFATLELLIALVLMIAALVAVNLLVFGNQSAGIDNQTNNEAQVLGQSQLEAAKAQANNNFDLLTNTPNVVSGIYTASTTVTDLSPCSKNVLANVVWQVDRNRFEQVHLNTDFGDPAAVVDNGGACNTPADPGWRHPVGVSDIGRGGSGDLQTTDIKARNGLLYVSAHANSAGKPDLLIFDVTNVLTTHTVIDKDTSNTGGGVNALSIVNTPATLGHTYAYLANSDNTNQLQVADVSNPSSINLLPASYRTPAGISAEATSIYYYKNRIYIGTKQIGNPLQDEFHVYDVSAPTNPVWLNDYKVNANVNDITVHDDGLGHTLAYLATSGGSEDVIVLDVTNVSLLHAPILAAQKSLTSGHLAKSLYLLGHNLYVGELHSGDPEIFVADVSSAASGSVTVCPTCSFPVSGDVNGVVVSNNFAFLAISNGFAVLDVTKPSAISQIVFCPSAACTLSPPSLNHGATSITFDNNLAFVSEPKLGNEMLLVLKSGP